MSEPIYNMDYGYFHIRGKNADDLLKRLNEKAKEDGRTSPFVNLGEAFSTYGFKYYEDENEDITNVWLQGCSPNENDWVVLREVIGPFVEPGSYLVFADTNGLWAISFEENPEADNKVQGFEVDCRPVLFPDLSRMLASLKREADAEDRDRDGLGLSREVFLEMHKKYGPMNEKKVPDCSRRDDVEFTKRAKEAQRAFLLAFKNTETLETANLGVDLFYLMGAILMDTSIELFLDIEDHKQILSLFRDIFPEDDSIWSYIDLHEES